MDRKPGRVFGEWPGIHETSPARKIKNDPGLCENPPGAFESTGFRRSKSFEFHPCHPPVVSWRFFPSCFKLFFWCKRECHGKLRFGAWSYTRPEPRMTLFEAINYNFFQVFKSGPTYLGKLWREVCMMTPHLFIEVGGGWNAMIPYNLQHVPSCNINQPRSWKVYEHFRDLGCWKRYVGTLCPVKWADPSYKHLLKPRFSMWILPLSLAHKIQQPKHLLPSRPLSVPERDKGNVFRCGMAACCDGQSTSDACHSPLEACPQSCENFLDVALYRYFKILNHGNTPRFNTSFGVVFFFLMLGIFMVTSPRSGIEKYFIVLFQVLFESSPEMRLENGNECFSGKWVSSKESSSLQSTCTYDFSLFAQVHF